MPRAIVELAGIGKRYRVGARREPYLSLRDEIARLASPAAWRERAARTEFWALKEVSLSFEPGEAVGLIGRNGAGKSTLLKLLARITPPSAGSLTLRGRVASLLEVGTGFHPELTGRENITLNGALLGMTRKEIARKFDEIVEFAEIGQFLDTPVKRYSSGMYVRLAFAVAAHLEPEILLVDEVLAVGDAGFQRKCLGKMGDVAGAGRTVLFVSHNMAAIQALCPRAILLRSGRVEVDGRTDDAVAAHLRLCDPAFSEQAPAPMERAAGITRVWFRNAFGKTVSRTTSGSHLELCLSYTAPGNAPAVRVAAVFTDRFGTAVAFCDSQITGHGLEGGGRSGIAVCTFRRLPLAAGAYTVNVSMNCNEEPVDFIERAAGLDVEPGDFYGSGRAVDACHGAVLTEHTWSVEPSDAPTPAGAGSRSR